MLKGVNRPSLSQLRRRLRVKRVTMMRIGRLWSGEVKAFEMARETQLQSIRILNTFIQLTSIAQ
jgi:hypothetical protein